MPVRLFTTETDRTGPDVFAALRRTQGAGPTVLQAIVERVSGHGPRAHEVWLPPLASAPALDTVLRDAGPVRALTAPIGVVDRPFEQRRTPLIVDLSRAAGNVALVGAPQIRQVDGIADTDHRAGGKSRSAHGAVLLPRLRRWRVGFAARLAARRLGRRTGRSGAWCVARSLGSPLSFVRAKRFSASTASSRSSTTDSSRRSGTRCVTGSATSF